MLVHRPEFLPEIWFLYAVGTFWLILRFFVRIRTRGLCGLEPDDAFSFLVLICWTNMCVGIQITYYTGAAVDYTPEDMVDFTQSHLEQVEYGTKLYFMTIILMVFSLKGTVISFYERLAFCNWQNLLLKWTKVYCVLGFIAITCVLSFSCWPYSRNWAVRPYPGLECTAKPQFFIVLSCLNASGDALLLCIPIPLFWRLRLPLLKKIGMVILLSSGIFVMAACIIRVSLTVVPDVSLRIIARWGVRELSIGILAVNTAALRPMFYKSFWKPDAPRKSNYVFASLHRIQHIVSRNHLTNFALHSTSPGSTIIERYNQQNSHRDLEDPDDHVVSSDNVRVNEAPQMAETGVEKAKEPTTSHVDPDLEKGEETGVMVSVHESD